MASPLSSELIRGAIGESGAFFGHPPAGSAMRALRETEKTGTTFADSIGAKDLAVLRAKTAEELLAAVQKDPSVRFWPSVDGYVLPKDVATIFAEGTQSHVPLLAGWNAPGSELGSGLREGKADGANFSTTNACALQRSSGGAFETLSGEQRR